MRWITASELEQWARSNSARDALPKIVSDLILASSQDIAAIRFPNADKGQVRGFDGVLVSGVPGLNVPQGKSYWEIGTNADYKTKVEGDFDKRTKEVPRAEQADITLVLVSPWTWDDPKNKLEDWRAERKRSSSWKDVCYIDGSALETWLEQRPAVAALHARRTFGVKPQEGVRSTDEFWLDFAGQFEPMLKEEVLLCEREDAAQQLIQGLLQPSNIVSLLRIRRTKLWPSPSRRSARHPRISVFSSKLGPWSSIARRPAVSCSPATIWFSCSVTTPRVRQRNSRRLDRSWCRLVARRDPADQQTDPQLWRGRLGMPSARR